MTRRTRILVSAAAAAAIVGLVVTLVTLRSNRTEPAAPTSSPAQTSTSPGGETTNLVVYFHRDAPDDPRKVVAVQRSVPKTVAVATAALNELLPGPTAQEKASGHWSIFVPETAKTLKSVRRERCGVCELRRLPQDHPERELQFRQRRAAR